MFESISNGIQVKAVNTHPLIVTVGEKNNQALLSNNHRLQFARAVKYNILSESHPLRWMLDMLDYARYVG